jgi:DNA-binding MarR family transcriptional regulator
MPHRGDTTRRLLDELESDPALSQRALARRLGVSLGLINQLLRGLIRERWLRHVRGTDRRVQYVVTSDGLAARDQMWRAHLQSALALYGTVRDRVRRGLEACATDPSDGDGASSVVLYGVGDVAQIAFACAADLGVQLVGFVDDCPRESFLGLPVHAPSALTTMALAGQTFDWLVVATLVNHEAIRGRLEEVGFPLERVSWL